MSGTTLLATPSLRDICCKIRCIKHRNFLESWKLDDLKVAPVYLPISVFLTLLYPQLWLTIAPSKHEKTWAFAIFRSHGYWDYQGLVSIIR